jgi:hypothetical protein
VVLLAAPQVAVHRSGGVVVYSTTRAGARAIAADCRSRGAETCAGELTRGDARAFLGDCPLSGRALARRLDAAAAFAAFLGADRISTRTEAGGYPYTCELEPSLAGWVASIGRAITVWL